VRLVVAENQARGRHLKKSRRCARSNRPIIDTLGGVIERGRRDGSFRAGVDPVDDPHGDRRARHVQRHQPHTFAAIFQREMGARAMSRAGATGDRDDSRYLASNLQEE
jgi:hypothetical protein